MRKNIELLIKSGITAYKVSKETGLSRNPIERLFRGDSTIDNLTLKSAEILSNYWEGNKMIRVKRTEVLTDSTLKFFALPQHKEEFNKHFPEDKTRKIMMIIDEDFYKELLVHPVIIDERYVGNFMEGALEGITPYKYEHLSTMDNIHEHEYYNKISDCDTADYTVSKRLQEPYRSSY